MKTDLMYVKNNKLYIGNYSLEELAKKYQTPLYVYDECQIRRKIESYQFKNFENNVLQNNVSHNNLNIEENNNRKKDVIFKMVYASKAFICPKLCDIINEYNCYIDAVSSGDLYLMNKSGFPMDKVLLHGNNKSNEDLTMALKLGVGYIVCDNVSELTRLEKLCIQENKKVKTLFRINPGVEAHTHAFIQTAMLDSKFGESIFDEKRIEDMINFYKKSERLIFEGFHTHIGSQIDSKESFISLVHVVTNFIKKVNSKYNIDVNTIDFGGGIAIKYLDSDIEVDIHDVITDMVKTCINDLKDTNITIQNIFVEPGRSIVGDAGFTLYTCGGVKRTFAGVEYVFIDGGMNDNIRPALYDASYSLDNASCVTSSKEKKMYNVAGKCCESGDMIARKIMLYPPSIGDVIVTYATGAYCYSMSMNYNGLTRGAVIFVNDKEAYEVIKKQSYEDLVRTCIFNK